MPQGSVPFVLSFALLATRPGGAPRPRGSRLDDDETGFPTVPGECARPSLEKEDDHEVAA
jgi:hypothetical protein